MTVTTEDNNRNNIYAKEPEMVPVDPDYRPMVAWDVRGELMNGRLAMISILVGMLSYLATGKLFFFIW
jgi:hypothetical protein